MLDASQATQLQPSSGATRRPTSGSWRTPSPGSPRDPAISVADALAGAVSYATVRQFVQDRIIRDVTVAANRRAAQAWRVAVAVGAGRPGLHGARLHPVPAHLRLGGAPAAPAHRGRHRGRRADRAAAGRHGRLRGVRGAPPTNRCCSPRWPSTARTRSAQLAAAFNRVRSTSIAMVEQQATSRRNIAVMFANIARRTQNLVGRQRTQVRSLRGYVTEPRAVEQLARLDQQRPAVAAHRRQPAGASPGSSTRAPAARPRCSST